MRGREFWCGAMLVVASYGCPRPATCPPGEVLLPEGCALDCPPGATTGCRDTGVSTDAADVRDDGASTMDVPDVTDVVDATPGLDVVDVSLACDGGETACMGRCVATQTDTMNCGACANVCPSPAGSTASCVMGMCRATCIQGYEMVGSACEVIAPRPVFPPGTSTVTNLRPTLKWALPMGVDGAQVELCRDRACTMMIERVTATGASARPMAELPRSSVVFWRVRGRVGATTGTRTSPTWQFRTRATSTTVDTAYGTELDVNGDGFTDLAVGAPGANAGAGAVRFYYGGPTGPSVSVSREITGNLATSLLVGTIVTSAGDVDGDGFGDVLIAAPLANVGARMETGQVLVFHGSSSGIAAAPTLTLEGSSTRDQFGLSASAAGDLNGDGFGDVVVGAPQVNMAGLSGIGEVSVCYGSSGGLSPAAVSRLPGAYLVAGGADFDGDQFSDIAVGHGEMTVGATSFAGVAFVLHGRSMGVDPTPRRVFQGRSAGDGFGVVHSIGDVDGDGFGDLAVAAPLADPAGVMNAGNVSFYAGSTTGLIATPFAELEGSVAAGVLGLRVAVMRDCRRTGRDCVVVGDFRASPGGRVEAGAVRIYGVSTARALSLEQSVDGPLMGERFGAAVSSGDHNGDAIADLVVGVPRKDVGGVVRAGTAWVYPGRAADVNPVASHAYVGRSMDEAVGRCVGSTTP